MRTEPLVTASLVGFASGLRSAVGLGAFVFARYGTSKHARLASAANIVAILGESTVDKLPSTPSRLKPPSLVFRAVAGGLGAYGLTERASRETAVTAAAVGAVAALAGSYAGAAYRAEASKRVPAVAAAIAEDVAANALTIYAESRVGLITRR